MRRNEPPAHTLSLTARGGMAAASELCHGIRAAATIPFLAAYHPAFAIGPGSADAQSTGADGRVINAPAQPRDTARATSGAVLTALLPRAEEMSP